MITNYIKIYLDHLVVALNENRKKLELPNNMKIEKVFIEESSYESRLRDKGKSNDENIPFLLIRPLSGKQKYENGMYSKTQKYLLRIAIKNENLEDGYSEISHIADKIVSFFTKNSSATMKREKYSYHVNLEEIKTELNLELTGGDYWAWDILIDLDIPIY